MKVNRKMLRNIISESLEDLESSPDPEEDLESSPDPELAIFLLKGIIKEIPRIPEENLRKYVNYLATRKIPQILSNIPEKE